MSLIVRVYMYVSWSVCLSHFHSVNASICVRLYCHWLYVYRYLSSSKFLSVSLFHCLSQCPGIILVNLRVHLLIGIFLSLFVSQCVKQCPTILSLIVGVTVHLLIRVAHSPFFPSECFYPCSVIIVSDFMCIVPIHIVSSSPFVSLSLFLCVCLSVRVYYW